MNGVIYFLEGAIGYKIGHTIELKTRLAYHRREFGEIRVIAVLEGTKQEELSLHRRFKPYRVFRQEWYSKNEAILNYALQNGTTDYSPYVVERYTNLVVPRELHRQLLFLAQITGKSMSDVIAGLIAKEVEL